MNVLGIANPTQHLDFERKVKGRRIDVFYEDMGILIENKSRGISLTYPNSEARTGTATHVWSRPSSRPSGTQTT